jgi:hypothetical protein
LSNGNLPRRYALLGAGVVIAALSVSACALDEPYECRSLRSEYRAHDAEVSEIVGRNVFDTRTGSAFPGPTRSEWQRGVDDYDRYHYLRGQISGLAPNLRGLGCDPWDEDEVD